MNKAIYRALQLLVLYLLTGCSQEPTDPVLRNYVAVQEALAADDFERAKVALVSMIRHAPDGLRKTAEKTANQTDITLMRRAFKELSDVVVDRLQVPKNFVKVYCSMVEGDKTGRWIQRDGKIMNPYFGAKMLHCGNLLD